MTAKRILVILSTIASIVFVFPFSIYFGALGLMFLTFAESVSSIIDVIYIISGVFYLSTPILCIVGIILSFIFIAKKKYKKGRFLTFKNPDDYDALNQGDCFEINNKYIKEKLLNE